MDTSKLTMLDAFTRFDNLAQQFATRNGGRLLTHKQKVQLDEALVMHEQVAAALKVSTKAAVPQFDNT